MIGNVFCFVFFYAFWSVKGPVIVQFKIPDKIQLSSATLKNIN